MIKKMRKTIHILGTTNQKQSAVNVFLIQFFLLIFKKVQIHNLHIQAPSYQSSGPVLFWISKWNHLMLQKNSHVKFVKKPFQPIITKTNT